MVKIDCINCGDDFSRNIDSFEGIVRCPSCNKNMKVTVIDNKIIKMDIDVFQFMEDMRKSLEETKEREYECTANLLKYCEITKEIDQKRLEIEKDMNDLRTKRLIMECRNILKEFTNKNYPETTPDKKGLQQIFEKEEVNKEKESMVAYV